MQNHVEFEMRRKCGCAVTDPKCAHRAEHTWFSSGYTCGKSYYLSERLGPTQGTRVCHMHSIDQCPQWLQYAATDTWCLGANRLKWCTSHIKESTLKYILLPTYVSNWNLKWGLSLNFNSRVSNQMILLRTLIHPGEYYVYYLRAATTLYWPIRCCSCPCMIVNFLPMIRGMFICSIFFTKLICRMELRQTAVP